MFQKRAYFSRKGHLNVNEPCMELVVALFRERESKKFGAPNFVQ